MEEVKNELVVKIMFDENGLPAIDGMGWCGDPRKMFAVVYAIENNAIEYFTGDVFESFYKGGVLVVRVPATTTASSLWVIKRMIEGMAALLWEVIFGTLHGRSIASRNKIAVPSGAIIAA